MVDPIPDTSPLPWKAAAVLHVWSITTRNASLKVLHERLRLAFLFAWPQGKV